MEQMQQDPMMQAQAEQGRATDTVLGHLSLGEVIIPRAMLDDPEVMQAIQGIFQAYGENLAEFTVGDPANKINPETGYPEFFKFKKFFKKIAPFIAPALSVLAPGLGTAIGAALGAGSAFAPVVGGAVLGGGSGALSGGGVRGALTGAALGGAGGAVSSALGGGFNDTALGRGISGIGDSVSSGLSGIGDAVSGATRGIGDLLGTGAPAGSAPIQGLGQISSSGLGSAADDAFLSNITSGVGKVAGAGAGAAPSSYGNIGNLLSIGSALGTSGAQDKAAEQLLQSQRDAAGYLEPYSNPQFTAGDFTADPGYQFRLQQGQQALDRSQAAKGGLFSGQALKASQQYGQGLADQTYQDAYSRWLQTQQQGAQVAGAKAGISNNIGNIKANRTIGINNTLTDAANQIFNPQKSIADQLAEALRFNPVRKTAYGS